PIEAAVPLARTGGATTSLGGRRLLVVDDNETNRRILRDMLGAEGLAVHEAARAHAGLDTLRRGVQAGAPYDLAILDAQMPDLDGFALAAAVRADPELAATKLLILTSAGQRGDGERCRHMGIQAYLTKPIARATSLKRWAPCWPKRRPPEPHPRSSPATRSRSRATPCRSCSP